MTHTEDKNFGYSEREGDEYLPHLSLGEWEAHHEIIKNSPETLKAEKQIEVVAKLLQQYLDGLIIAVDVIDNIKEKLIE